MIREQVLDKAKAIISSDREAIYGPPADNFAKCAELWSAYFRAKYNFQPQLSIDDVAMLNILQKVARTMSPTVQLDTYIDLAGYSALAGEFLMERKYDQR